MGCITSSNDCDCNFGRVKEEKHISERAVVVVFVFVSLVSVIVGTLFVRLVEANPYWWYTAVPPDEYTKPPVISIFSPENNTVFTEDSFVLSFQVDVGESKTALDMLLFFIVYETDWKNDNDNHFAPWNSSSFSHEVNLTRIPEGSHSIKIQATERGTYKNATAFNIDSSKTIFFNINTTPETDAIPEFRSWIVLPLTMIVILIVAVLRKRGARATNSCLMTMASERFTATLAMKKLRTISLISLLITTILILSSVAVHAFEVTDTITLEHPGGYYGIAYDSAKNEIFLTNVDFDLVSVISDSNNSVVANIPIGSQPVGIAYDSAMDELFVANYASDSVSVISDITNTVVANIPVGSQPFAVAYDSGKGEIFVANYNSSSVSVISDSTNTVVANIPVGSQPCALAYDSSKGEIFVGHAGCNQVLVISDSTNAVVANITVEDQSVSLAYDSGKGEIFVANYNSNSISVIADSTNLIVGSINVGVNPIGLAYDSANGYIFVANYNSNSVSVISDSTNTVIANVSLENQPQGICYDSGKGKIFVTYSESNRISVISDSSLPFPSPSTPEFPSWTLLVAGFSAVILLSIIYRRVYRKDKNK